MSESSFVFVEGDGGEVDLDIRGRPGPNMGEIFYDVNLMNIHHWFMVTSIEAPIPERYGVPGGCLQVVSGLTTALQIDNHQFFLGPMAVQLVCPPRQNNQFYLHESGKPASGVVRVKWRRLRPEEVATMEAAIRRS